MRKRTLFLVAAFLGFMLVVCAAANSWNSDAGMRTLFLVAKVLWCMLVCYEAANSLWD